MILFYVYMSLLWGRLAGCSPVVNCFILSANLLTCIKTCSCFVDAKIKDLTISCKFCYTCFDSLSTREANNKMDNINLALYYFHLKDHKQVARIVGYMKAKEVYRFNSIIKGGER